MKANPNHLDRARRRDQNRPGHLPHEEISRLQLLSPFAVLRKLRAEIENQLDTTIRKNPLGIRCRRITLQRPEALHKTVEGRPGFYLAIIHSGACQTRPSAYWMRMRMIFSVKRLCSSRLREETLSVRVGGEVMVTVNSFVLPGPTFSSLVNC